MKRLIFLIIAVAVLTTSCSGSNTEKTSTDASTDASTKGSPTIEATPKANPEEENFNKNMQAFLESLLTEGEKDVKIMSYGAFIGDKQVKENGRYVELKDKFNFKDYINWTRSNNATANSEGKKEMKYNTSCGLSEAEFKEFINLHKEQNEKRKSVESHKFTQEGKGKISIKKNSDGSYTIECKEGTKYLKKIDIDKNGQRFETSDFVCMLSDIVKPEDNLKLKLNGFVWEDREESFRNYDGNNYDAVLGTGYEVVMGRLSETPESIIFYSKMCVVNGEAFTYSEIIDFQ